MKTNQREETNLKACNLDLSQKGHPDSTFNYWLRVSISFLDFWDFLSQEALCMNNTLYKEFYLLGYSINLLRAALF